MGTTETNITVVKKQPLTATVVTTPIEVKEHRIQNKKEKNSERNIPSLGQLTADEAVLVLSGELFQRLVHGFRE